jgi:hypothetical protein
MRTDVNLLGNGYASTVLKNIETGFSKITNLSPYDFNVLRRKINEFPNSKLEYTNNEWILSIQNPVDQSIKRPSNNSEDREWRRNQLPIFYIIKTTIKTNNSLNPGQFVFDLKYSKGLGYDEKIIFKNEKAYLTTHDLYFLNTQLNQRIALYANRPSYIIRTYN